VAKKHKHEEHVNHERWLVSYADMMTLLFALFVVLYAMSQSELARKELAESVRWAFHISGEGKTKDTGVFDLVKGGGEVLAPAPLVTPQDGAMREFLEEQLERYDEVTGRSLTIVQTDDTIAFTAPIGDFFKAAEAYTMLREVASWLEATLGAALAYSSRIDILIRTPDVLIGRDERGRVLSSLDLTLERLKTLERKVHTLPEVRAGMVKCSWERVAEAPGVAAHRWEDRCTVTVAFTNQKR
jgi:hypothetical protein